jgi:hypothetical protein
MGIEYYNEALEIPQGASCSPSLQAYRLQEARLSEGSDHVIAGGAVAELGAVILSGADTA